MCIGEPASSLPVAHNIDRPLLRIVRYVAKQPDDAQVVNPIMLAARRHDNGLARTWSLLVDASNHKRKLTVQVIGNCRAGLRRLRG